MGTPERTDDLIASYSSKGPTYLDHVVKPDRGGAGDLLVSNRNKQYHSVQHGVELIGCIQRLYLWRIGKPVKVFTFD